MNQDLKELVDRATADLHLATRLIVLARTSPASPERHWNAATEALSRTRLYLETMLGPPLPTETVRQKLSVVTGKACAACAD